NAHVHATGVLLCIADRGAGGVEGPGLTICRTADVSAQVAKFRGNAARCVPTNGALAEVCAANILLGETDGGASKVDRRRESLRLAVAIGTEVAQFSGRGARRVPAEGTVVEVCTGRILHGIADGETIANRGVIIGPRLCVQVSGVRNQVKRGPTVN